MKTKSQLTNEIKRVADYHRYYNKSMFDLCENKNVLFSELAELAKCNCFAANIAITILKNIEDTKAFLSRVKYAYISDKQAFIIACGLLENNIHSEYFEI